MLKRFARSHKIARNGSLTLFIIFDQNSMNVFPTPGALWTYIVCVTAEIKIIKGREFSSSGCHSPGPYWVAVMDIQMSMIRDIMICRGPLTSSPRTNCILVSDEELLLASFAPLRVMLSIQVMLRIFINVFHRTAVGLSHHQ